MGIARINPNGRVTTMFSTMRRMVTLHAAPLRYITIRKNMPPSGIKIVKRKPTRYD
jgi:hypothetical protein